MANRSGDVVLYEASLNAKQVLEFPFVMAFEEVAPFILENRRLDYGDLCQGSPDRFQSTGSASMRSRYCP